ncbi:MAG TPA: SDR family NAD(P)-dependent oxidoreductase [Candidatus Acidoferrales bacterium]|nr:SDR family NAD(P)-dependent oxidoreductase [Candidatus Acidoferrales bacterium]
MPATTSAHGGTALVTGATDGLGRAAALLLAERGYRVFAAGRSAERRASLEQAARERSLPLETVELDVCDDVSVNHCVSEIERRAGPVEILVNNAGIAIAAVVEEITIDDLRKQYETNIFGVLRATQRVLPLMRHRGRGRIINMSSIAGKVAIPIMGPYASSKHALEALSDALRLELRPFGIHVVLIEPGVIRTSMSRTAERLSIAYVQGAERSPYGHVYQGFRRNWDIATKAARDTPEDCARIILQAVEETPPRARYLVTREAKLTALMRRFMPDRMFDSGIQKRLGLKEPKEGTLQ